jgi:hypothetical protein
MNEKVKPYFENTTEAALACLVTMVQGDLMSLTAAHWFIASQTGLIAGAITATAILLTRLRRPWIISLSLGAVTAIVDYFVHPGMLSTYAIVEAIITGLGAAVLSFAFAHLFALIARVWSRRASISL